MVMATDDANSSSFWAVYLCRWIACFHNLLLWIFSLWDGGVGNLPSDFRGFPCFKIGWNLKYHKLTWKEDDGHNIRRVAKAFDT